jgi:hypothetical protein
MHACAHEVVCVPHEEFDGEVSLLQTEVSRWMLGEYLKPHFQRKLSGGCWENTGVVYSKTLRGCFRFE